MRFSFIHVLRGFSWIWAVHRDAMTDERKRKMLLMMPSLKQDKSEKRCINRQLELCCYQVKAWGHIRMMLDSCPRRDTIILDRQHYKMPPIRQAVSQRSLPQPWACFFFELWPFQPSEQDAKWNWAVITPLFFKLQILSIWMRQFASLSRSHLLRKISSPSLVPEKDKLILYQ